MIVGDAAFVRVGGIIGPGWHIQECCRRDATVLNAMYDLWWDCQKDLVGSPTSMTLSTPCVVLWGLISYRTTRRFPFVYANRSDCLLW